ncbi:YfbM family protein [Actinoplanes subglobosus]|uniref:YfbM family protein n=1 Tax=Actinoplanes subglobosus TaxID=1547892 RepID=A0ABV8IX64_9ACTN
MELIGRRLSDAELKSVHDDPDTVEALLFGDLNDYDAEMPEPELNLDKFWHGVHYLLAGSAWDLGDGVAGAAVLGGEDIGEDGGYGPARLVTADRVRVVADALDALDDDTLRARFDRRAMKAAEIYPDIWHEDVPADRFLGHVADLRRFYRSAADNDQALLLMIT